MKNEELNEHEIRKDLNLLRNKVNELIKNDIENSCSLSKFYITWFSITLAILIFKFIKTIVLIHRAIFIDQNNEVIDLSYAFYFFLSIILFSILINKKRKLLNLKRVEMKIIEDKIIEDKNK